jgi:hypothetical protein
VVAISNQIFQIILSENEILIKISLINKGIEKKKFDIKSKIVRIENCSFAVEFSNIGDEQKVVLWECLVNESNRKLK